MESREDKLIALIVLLSACLITVVFLFAVTWLNDVRRSAQTFPEPQACYAPVEESASSPPARR
ncbi:MAG: hypothetical protein E7C36_10875 [Mixta calida]|jgi:hypothetical protein|uniref:YmiA family membrane protein n=1 Tax=Mixta calida TaxID=665913 RepID=A0ABM6RZV2_9GAMM|nr:MULTISPECIES: hypothetical protein [Mixta]AIX74168.1 hypothetical protein PSNIH2_10510 [Pantoea sp. PSNIH2]MBS6058086.1 hypothetical protein [Pantoea sp.]POU51565.1 hypothetical protein C3380_02245 [Pantoea sp. PSNIH5]POU69359.1 hypothetical protein C3374_05115 [Pantoea sp. PSNIH4]POY69470.1 hypothetical protein C3402_02655 [Pantoea sp. PSNIH3]